MSSDEEQDEYDSDAEFDADEDDDDTFMDGGSSRKKRLALRLRGTRKKSRSMDEAEQQEHHTGLSPRLNRMDIISAYSANSPTRVSPAHGEQPGVFFLDEGVETFSVDGDPRVNAVMELYRELDKRLQRAAVLAGLQLDDPAVATFKKQLALRAAELEASLAERFGSSSGTTYRDAIFNALCWIQSANEADLREILEGRLGNLAIQNVPGTSSHPGEGGGYQRAYPTQIIIHPAFTAPTSGSL